MTDFDFSAPPRMSREHSRLLEIAFETFARQWANQLGSRLRCATEVTLSSVRQEPYDVFSKDLPEPTLLVAFSLDGKSATNSVLQLPPELALAHLDHALGGSGGPQPQRELTDIELIISRGMVERALESINYSFASIAPLTPRIDGLLQDPQLLQIARAADMVLLASFEVTLGALTDTATLVTPLGPLAKALSDAATRDQRSLEEIARAKEAARLISIGLADVPVDVAFTLSPTIAAPNQMLRLAIGDVIRCSHPAKMPINVEVKGTRLRRAVVTSKGNRRACLIVDPEENIA